LQVASDAKELGIASNLRVTAASGYLIQGDLDRPQVGRLANELFADRVVERSIVLCIGNGESTEHSAVSPVGDQEEVVHVLTKAGVMDPVAQSAQSAIQDFGFSVDAVRTLRKFWLADLSEDKTLLLAAKVLANDAIEQVVVGPLMFDRLELGSDYAF